MTFQVPPFFGVTAGINIAPGAKDYQVKGKFRTRGRFAAATVRGTIWSMQDRCDGTLTRVTRGTVVVRDLRTSRSVVVRTGKSALVPKR